MPNTDPVNDSPEVTAFILDKAGQAEAGVRVYPVAAVTRGSRGADPTDFAALRQAGAIAVSDDGLPVADSRTMRRALEAAGALNMVVISHSEELSLAAGGAMNEGAVAKRLGLGGIPNAAESIMVMRDIALSELTGAAVHIAHVSTAQSVRAIRAAKNEGIPVTAETAPHYFTLTDAAVADYRTRAKMNPPLRSDADVAAVRDGLADGTIDVIATDHAPHADREKAEPFANAANGIVGLETSVALSLALVGDGVLSLTDLIRKMATAPARILGLTAGLTVGAPADITVLDPSVHWTVDVNRFRSLSRNCPYHGWPVKGRAVLTMVGGTVVFNAMDLK